ncbi:hypothetical protein N7449_010886 [Penicillium cf. viridicatum]|uniref:FAD/NAD(P)-binding domain-containing protein n=1 Tax=Penicillium cf. viridicatum TaxID=2972119 RepID=A0A9W9J167_9EURO|nr:hypothetical protein N7449_010886 [Penicillium cf. viridicatum]
MTIFDALIIGGGPAGLSVATGLARQLHRAIVFDSGVYRNALASHMYNVASESILSRYDTIQFENVEIKKVERNTEGSFNAIDSQDRVWTGKKLVFANGVRDIFLDIAGYGECWARGIFHCLFCHGFEERGCEAAGVLAIGDMANTMAAMHVARMARRFATTVTIYTHGAQEVTQALEKASYDTGIKVDSRPITRLVKGPGPSDVDVEFEDGTHRTEGFLAHKPKTHINGPFAEQLGLHLTSDGNIETTEPFYNTSVPGVFAAGDCAVPMKVVVTAMSSGTFVAGGLAGQLQEELYSGQQKLT